MHLDTTTQMAASEAAIVQNWQDATLPDTWADRLAWWQWGGYLTLLRVLLARRRPVVVPPDMPMAAELPDYVKHEFHAIPNGNYSNRWVAPYIKGFEHSMLGRMRQVRSWVVSRLAGLDSVLDVGCGGGKLAGQLERSGATDVWGLDASPYMLKCAAAEFPRVKFVQGLAEQLTFRDGRFSAVCACFLFHELPEEAGDQALREMHRVLAPGGLLVIIEPGPEQLSTVNPLKLWRLAGWAGIYFGIMAHLVYEPYVAGWHGRNQAEWLSCHGFEPLQQHSSFPMRIYLARRLQSSLLEP